LTSHTASALLKNAITLATRLEKVALSSTRCFSGVETLRLAEIKFSRQAGLLILLIAIPASDGILGERLTIFVAVSFMERIEASKSTPLTSISCRYASTLARKYGCVSVNSLTLKLVLPWMTMLLLPSGIFITFN